MKRYLSYIAIICLVSTGLAVRLSPAYAAEGRFLGSEEIILYGVGLKVDPAHQVVPKDMATIVSTYMQAPTLPPRDADVFPVFRDSIPKPVPESDIFREGLPKDKKPYSLGSVVFLCFGIPVFRDSIPKPVQN
ncbi:MAG: hypothetical protein HZA12_05815 [Nitrospirae bacterium]|nr:hypothetical protein [Nitrospirota bacterium]